MMGLQYAILIYESQTERQVREAAGAEQDEVTAAYQAFTNSLVEAGALQSGEALELPHTATTLIGQGADLPAIIQDGPYADTKEQLGGFFIIEAQHLDEAIAWARRCPASQHGRVEIRPVSRR